MAGEEITRPFLSTKLHRPPVDRNHVHRPHLLDRLDQYRQRPLTLVSAPAGYGKSVLISCWLENCKDPGAWISLDKTDSDLRTFATYLIAAIETLFPETFLKTQAQLNASEMPPIEVLSKSLLSELDRIDQPFILVLDDYYLIKETTVHNLIAEILKHPPLSLHLVIVGRHDPPLPISTLRAQSKMIEIRTQDLRFTVAETEMLLNKILGIEIDPSISTVLEAKSEGWVTGLHLAALSMRERNTLDPALLEPHVDAQYVMEYLFTEVFSRQPPEISQYLLATAILDRFCGPLCEAVCTPGGEPFSCEIGGWEFLDWLKKENVFLIPLDPEKRWFRYHHLFQKLLFNQLKRHCGAEEIKELHAQASSWFTENGLIEEALKHALAAGNIDSASNLVARFSHQLLNDQQWFRLERCLYQLPRDRIDTDPALLMIEAWLHYVRHNFIGLTNCVQKIENLDIAASPSSLFKVKHLEGHFPVLKGALEYLSTRGDSALVYCQHALRHIPPNHKRVHLLAHTCQILAYQMVGDYDHGLSNYMKAMEGYIHRDKNYYTMYLAKLALTQWIDADLPALQQSAEGILELANETPSPTIPTYYGLHYLGIIHYHRNELQYAEEKMAQVLKAHYAASPINFAHNAFALALTYQAQGKPDQAMKISKSVVHDSIETNNTDMLQIARTFEAELNLCQGRNAKAYRWVEKYHAKPFRPTFRFYMPQLTAVKILLAQDTADSRRRTADLLKQLYDFVVLTHNKRFQIDVLALQALLHDSQDDQPAALRKLIEGLAIAEPGGFIRVFVDLGPKMANLLKKLVKQNVAVDYIGRILNAFSEDEHRARQAESDHLTAKSPPLGNQPLAEPLTLREVDVLELLAQRLQNKEIAAKLYISPETVKGHLKNIYQKLDTGNRREAVEKARNVGIL